MFVPLGDDPGDEAGAELDDPDEPPPLDTCKLHSILHLRIRLTMHQHKACSRGHTPELLHASMPESALWQGWSLQGHAALIRRA